MSFLKKLTAAELKAIADEQEVPLMLWGDQIYSVHDTPLYLDLPMVEPIGLTSFFAFEVGGQESDLVSCAAGNKTVFREYVNGTWVDSSSAVFYPPSEFCDQLADWYQPLHVRLKIEPNATFHQVVIGYEAEGDVIDYLFNFAIPEFLSVPVRLGIPAAMERGAAEIHPSLGKEQVTEIAFQPQGEKPIIGSFVEGKCRIRSSLSAKGTVLFSFVPKVEYAEAETSYQVTSQPCVVIRGLTTKEFKFPCREQVFEQNGSTKRRISLTRHNQPFEVISIAPSEAMARQISTRLMAEIRKVGGVYLKRYDTNFAIAHTSGIKVERKDSQIPGALTKVKFDCLIRGILSSELLTDLD